MLGLDVELNLANAAPAEFKIGPLGGQPVIDLVDMDLALDRMDVGNGGKIEVLAPDKARQLRQEGLAQRHIPGHGAGLDEGGPLPVLADGLVIVEGGGDRHGRRGRAGIRTQAQVDPEHIAVRRALLQKLRQGPCHRQGGGLRIASGRHQHLVGLVKDRDVDVAGIVQLKGPVLAHGNAKEPRYGACCTVRRG